MPFRKYAVAVFLVAVVLAVVCTSCGGGGSSSATGGGSVVQQDPVPTFDHVAIVVMENQSFDTVIGNSAMPYFNSLASQYGLATNYYGDSQNSLITHFMLTTGQKVTEAQADALRFDGDNVVRHLLARGKTWKSYAQSLPYVGYTGPNQEPYVKRENPFAYFSDVVNSPSQVNNLVPFDHLSQDLANNALPNYMWLLPDQDHNAHDCLPGHSTCTNNEKLAVADAWLQTNVAPLLASNTFKNTGLLVILFNCAGSSDTTHTGGKIAAVVISPKSKTGYRASTFYQHANTLRMMTEGLGLASYPGDASKALNMSEFFAK